LRKLAEGLCANVPAFVETKELKRRVRDCIQPGRDLGHVDGKKTAGTLGKQEEKPGEVKTKASEEPGEKACEDCELQT